MVGRWEGRWQSQGGMGGDTLKAVITKVDDDTYHVDFQAKYWKVFTFDAPVDLKVVKAPGKWTFTGSADLGIYGDYTYEGWCDGKVFYSTYTSDADHGEYRMERVAE